MAIAVTQEHPPDDLSWTVRPAGKTPSRWAHDEPDPANVIEDCTFSSQMNGGYKDASTEHPRDPRRSYADYEPYGDVGIALKGGDVVWEGRTEKPSGSVGGRRGTGISAAGWAAALEDDKAAQFGGIDGDLSKWGEPSTQHRLDSSKAGYPIVASASAGFSDKGETPPGVVIDFTNVSLEEGRNETGEQCYYGGGVDIGRLLSGFKVLAGGTGSAPWTDYLRVSIDDVLSTYKDGTDLNATTQSGAVELEAPTDGYKYAHLVSAWTGTGGGANMTDIRAWLTPKVVGRHGLPLQGTWPNVGFTAARMLRYLIPELAAPLTATDESLEDDGFVISQAWFSDPGTVAVIVDALTKYGLLDWFVYEDKLFQLRRPGSYGRVWKAYASRVDREGDAGQDGQRLWEELKVSWQDVSGRTLYAGPPGSGADFVADGLRVTDPDHPAVKAEVTRRECLNLQEICSPEAAIRAGERWLVEANELSQAGKASFTGYLLDNKGIMRPVSQMRAGDYIDFADLPDEGLRKVTSCSYTHLARTASADLDAPAEDVKALLERYGATLTRLSIS